MTKPTWRLVAKFPPPAEKDVLLYLDDEQRIIIGNRTCNKRKSTYFHMPMREELEDKEDITYWMPLPSKPDKNEY